MLVESVNQLPIVADVSVSAFLNDMEEGATDIVYDSASPAFNKQLKIKVVGCEARSSV